MQIGLLTDSLRERTHGEAAESVAPAVETLRAAQSMEEVR
ncbi:hypothetical protein TSOC111612_14850 [Tsukamurella ocularis]